MRKSIFAGLCLLVVPVLLAQQTLNNDTVIKMVKAGLSDDVVITTINASPGHYDTSADGLIALKSSGASDKIISAIMVRASSGSPAAAPAGSSATPAATASVPSGHRRYRGLAKDKSGAWAPMMPEIVNFKTGGVVKSIATVGIVKGDINGHIQGSKARAKPDISRRAGSLRARGGGDYRVPAASSSPQLRRPRVPLCYRRGLARLGGNCTGFDLNSRAKSWRPVSFRSLSNPPWAGVRFKTPAARLIRRFQHEQQRKDLRRQCHRIDKAPRYFHAATGGEDVRVDPDGRIARRKCTGVSAERS